MLERICLGGVTQKQKEWSRNWHALLDVSKLTRVLVLVSGMSDLRTLIMPDKLGGDHMASLVVTPDVIEFVGRLTIEGENTANLEEISVNDLPSEYLKKTILDLDLRKKTGCTVIGFKAPDNSYIINPEASLALQKDSHLIVLGRPAQISKLRALF